jgi:hypothetical protein
VVADRLAEPPTGCGFDGVEIFAAYHAIVDPVWLRWSNRRDVE